MSGHGVNNELVINHYHKYLTMDEENMKFRMLWVGKVSALFTSQFHFSLRFPSFSRPTGGNYRIDSAPLLNLV